MVTCDFVCQLVKVKVWEGRGGEEVQRLEGGLVVVEPDLGARCASR